MAKGGNRIVTKQFRGYNADTISTGMTMICAHIRTDDLEREMDEFGKI